MKKIITIFTGGTIGSRKTEAGEISPDPTMAYSLLEMYKKSCTLGSVEDVSAKPESLPVFIIEEPYYILSENLTGKELTILGRCVKKHLSEKIDGIIILHGTDTLAYTAAFLDILFRDAPIPILLVSSDHPLEDESANGLRNFNAAVEFIKGGFGNGAFVSYANRGETVKIHRGMRVVRHMEYSADLFSAGNSFYGSFTEDGRFLKNPAYAEWEIKAGQGGKAYLEQYIRSDRTCFDHKEEMDEIFLTETCPEILRLISYPGMVYPKLTDEVKVVLIESYHSGTIGISDGLKRFVKEAGQRRIPIYLTGLSGEDAVYETVSEYMQLGIIPVKDQTGIALYMMLWIALAFGIFQP